MYQAYANKYPKGEFITIALLKIKNTKKVTSKTPLVNELDFGEYYGIVIGNNKYDHFPNLKTDSSIAVIVP